VVLYNGYDVEDEIAWKISVNFTARENEITVKNVSTDDSGAYSCHELEKFTRKVIFYLKVKGTY